VQRHIQREILENPFFIEMDGGRLSVTHLQEAMVQYYHFRNRFHRWWGLAIASIDDDPELIEPLVVNLATEFPISPQFGDKPHKLYFEDFLDALGVQRKNLSLPLEATRRQIYWFLDRYQNYPGDDRVTAMLAALGPGNELATD